MTTPTKTKKRPTVADDAVATLAAPHGFDQHGLPIGTATFTKAQVKQIFNLTDRQLRRYDAQGVLRAFRPSGPKSPPMYKRTDLVTWLERDS